MSTARLAGGTGSARSPVISPLASPEAPAQLDLRSFHRSPRRRHRLSSISDHFTLASPEAPAQLDLRSFHARLAGGTGSARTAATAHRRDQTALVVGGHAVVRARAIAADGARRARAVAHEV